MEPCPSPPSAGRMYLFYGNKTSVQFQNFSPTVVHPGDLQTHILPAWPSPLPRALTLLVWLPGRGEADEPWSRTVFSSLQSLSIWLRVRGLVSSVRRGGPLLPRIA